MMKTILRICLLLVCVTANSFVNATIIRVNNLIAVNDNTNKIYKSFNDAYTAAVGGDTIMMEGSPNAYAHTSSAFSIAKRLVIIGPGYMLDKNPQTQANQQRAIIDFNVEMVAGSAGSVLTGLSFDNRTSQSLSLEENNISVTRCYIYGLYLSRRYNGTAYSAISGLRITQNFIDNFAFWSNSTDGFTDVTFNNNIVLDGINATSAGTAQRIFSSVENNTFVYDYSSVFALSTPSFKNNILLLANNATITISSQAIQNNLVNSDKLGTANGNKMYSVNDGTLFSGNIDDNIEIDNEYKVINALFNKMGTDGKEPGAFGGAVPYVLSGLPPVPAIYELTTSGAGSQQNGLPVTIKVKSN